MSRKELKEQVYRYLLEKADTEGRIEFTYDELIAKFNTERQRLYNITRDLRNDNKVNLVSKSNGTLRYYKTSREKEEKGVADKNNTYEVKITLSGDVLKPVIAKELDKTAKRILKSDNLDAKMELAKEFAELVTIAKGNPKIETTARIPSSLLRNVILKQISNVTPIDKKQEDVILGIA